MRKSGGMTPIIPTTKIAPVPYQQWGCPKYAKSPLYKERNDPPLMSFELCPCPCGTLSWTGARMKKETINRFPYVRMRQVAMPCARETLPLNQRRKMSQHLTFLFSHPKQSLIFPQTPRQQQHRPFSWQCAIIHAIAIRTNG